MADDPFKIRTLRQSSITNFFARIHDASSSSVGPSSKRHSNASIAFGSSTHEMTDSWDVLEERVKASQLLNGQNGLNFTKESRSAGQISFDAEIPSFSESIEKTPTINDEASITHDADEAPSSANSSMAVDALKADSSMNSSVICPEWSGVNVSQLARYLQLSDYLLPELQSSARHTILFSFPLIPGTCPASSGGQYKDVWDYNHVQMPCSSHLRRSIAKGSDFFFNRSITVTRWELIRNNVVREYKSVTDLVPAICPYYDGVFDSSMIKGLINTLHENCSMLERQYFLSTLLPFIASLVIELPSCCIEPIPLLKSGMNHTITFSQRQIASILANAFFCTFPLQKAAESKTDAAGGFPGVNFDWLFALPQSWKGTRSDAKSHKIKCIMNYFYKIKEENPTGLVSFSRRSLDVFPNWTDSPTLLAKVHITHKGTIEDDGIGCLQVDFANKFIGGGVLQDGCVQEEIRFMVNPELIAARLFTECFKANECLIVTGAERFNNYSGYGDSFKFTDSHNDTTPFDAWGRRMTQIVAIDAYRFNKTDEQYQPKFILRELNKAYVGFYRGSDVDTCHTCHTISPLSAIATGNWGCGAFRGNSRLKFLLQLMACSVAGRDMIYFTFGDSRLQEELAVMYHHLIRVNASVGDIFRIICRYNDDVVLKEQEGKKRISLYTFIYESNRSL